MATRATAATKTQRREPESHLPIAYETNLGKMIHGTIEHALEKNLRKYERRISLIFTSPPFPLNRKKKYGNLNGAEYLKWLGALAPKLAALLKPDGSIVMELGNAWEPGRPVMSLLPLEALMAVLRNGNLNLCQQFVCHNPARLPAPAQWVTIERIRVKDSYTHVWWMSPNDKPYANNRHILTDYSPAMQELLRRQSYNSGKRPSGYDVSEESFLTNNGGAIPPNALQLAPELEDESTNFLALANTASSDSYSKYCKERELTRHPARMPAGLPKFFINFLTEPGDLVLDPFGGSNMTGAVAERLGRQWLSVEPNEEYIAGSRGRFQVEKFIK